MRLVTVKDYEEFMQGHPSVAIGNMKLNLEREWKPISYQPEQYAPEEWTIWSFPSRGDWATHKGNYRGNWSPFIPRNLIQRYTKVGEIVCDPMVGSGTTLVECKLLGRNAIGVDINPSATMVAMNRLDFEFRPLESNGEPDIEVFLGDARNLDAISNEQIDLVATHPPYCGIIPYSNAGIAADLSSMKLEEFIVEMGKVATECFRILRPNGHCAILIGDTREHRHYVPIHVGVLNKFLESGFILKEDIIKLQHNTTSTRERWGGNQYDFYEIAHEHLCVFRKPEKEEKLNDYKHSMKWW